MCSEFWRFSKRNDKTRETRVSGSRFTDDFFFNRIMQNKELCRELAEVLLGIKVESVEFHETHRVLRREKRCSRKHQRKIMMTAHTQSFIIAPRGESASAKTCVR